MNYIAPYETISRLIVMSTANGQIKATVRHDDLILMIKLLLSGVDVDEEWYLRQYPDVEKAIIEEGDTKSAKQHYVDNGYFENRLPFPIPVDDAWYQQQYADVAASIREGGVGAQEHFIRQGYKEGRMPSAS